MFAPVLVFSSAYPSPSPCPCPCPCPGQWKIFRITFLDEGKAGREKKRQKWRQISGRKVHHLKGWEKVVLLCGDDLPPLMEPPGVTSSCLEVEGEGGAEEGCHGWTLQGRARSIVRSSGVWPWVLMVLSIPRGSLGSSCVQLAVGWQRGQGGGEESVESCRVERHPGWQSWGWRLGDQWIICFWMYRLVLLTSTGRWGPILEESPSCC